MKSFYILCFLCLLCYSEITAQSLEPQVLAGAGTTFSNSSGSLEFTVGEVISHTMNNGTVGKTLTNGFHQPNISISTNLGAEIVMPGLSVYPIPATDKVMIAFPQTPDNSLVELYDASGKLVFSGFSHEQEYKLTISHYTAGVYFLKVDKGNLFKIIKTN